MDDQTVIVRVLAVVWALLLAAVAAIWRMLNGKIEAKASSESVAHALRILDQHVTHDSGVHERIFEKLDEQTKLASRIEGILSEMKKRRAPWESE